MPAGIHPQGRPRRPAFRPGPKVTVARSRKRFIHQAGWGAFVVFLALSVEAHLVLAFGIRFLPFLILLFLRLFPHHVLAEEEKKKPAPIEVRVVERPVERAAPSPAVIASLSNERAKAAGLLGKPKKLKRHRFDGGQTGLLAILGSTESPDVVFGGLVGVQGDTNVLGAGGLGTLTVGPGGGGTGSGVGLDGIGVLGHGPLRCQPGTYIDGHRLPHPPEYTHNVSDDVTRKLYPPDAPRDGAHSEVKLFINEEGAVTRVSTLGDPGAALAHATREFAEQMKFNPGRDADGTACATTLVWRINWQAE